MKVMEILKDFFKNHIDVLIQFTVHVVILWLIIKFIDHASKKIKLKIQSQPNNTSMLHLLLALTKIIKVVAILLIVTSFLQSNGYSLTSLMTGLGITGLAIGLAAQETLSSVFGSISIMTDKVYKIGDYIYINDVEGTVEAINFHSTKIRTVENVLITIPNNITADGIVKTRTNEYKRILNEYFDIEYDTSNEGIEKAKEILKSICEKHDKISNKCDVFVSKLGENAITIQLFTSTKTSKWLDYMYIKDELYREAIRQFREHNINFAFPSRTVYLKQDNEN